MFALRLLCCCAASLLPLTHGATPAPARLAATANGTPDSPVGHWAGGFAIPNEFVSIRVRFDEGEDGLSATVTVPERGGAHATTGVERSGRELVWTIVEGGVTKAHFEARLDGDTLRGTVEVPQLKRGAKLDLLRVVELGDATRERYAGGFRLDDGSRLDIVPLRLGTDEVLGVRIPAHDVNARLFAVSTTDLVAGKGEKPLPITTRLALRLGDSGTPERIDVRIDRKELVALPAAAGDGDTGVEPLGSLPLLAVEGAPAVERRRVRIDAGDVTLAATLYVPGGAPRPCPAVVQLHGSAPTERASQWTYFTSTALRCGLAVLAFDKRGCGDSTGRLRSFTVETSAKLFDTLAGGAAAAHAWLREQDGIDPDRVGLIGGSQAGWIMPLVAEKTEGVRFIISACGPTVSAGEEDYHSGLVGNGLLIEEADRRLAAFDGDRGYDPRPVLRRVKTPILWLFGERDDIIPTRACLVEYEKLRAEGHLRHTAHVFPDTDHNFRTTLGDGVLLEPVIARWLEQIGVLD